MEVRETLSSIVELTADVVAAYVGTNSISLADLPRLITDVHAALTAQQQSNATLAKPVPAVPINKSITEHHLISLEDGTRHQLLKRHLALRYNMTPREYRQKWGLPPDYPMVAPGYSRRRSGIAKGYGLGKRATPSKSS